MNQQLCRRTYASAIARRIEEVVIEIKRPIVDVGRPGGSTETALNGVVVVNVEAERDINVVEAAQAVVQSQCDAIFVGLRDVEGTASDGEIANSGAFDLVQANTARNVYGKLST